MLEYEYRRSMQKNEILLWAEDAAKAPEYYEMMFVNNRIPGVLQFVQEKTETQNRYCYDVTTKQSVAERYEQEKVTKEQLQRLLRDIIQIVEAGRAFLIDEADYVIRPECMFYAKDSEQLSLCCYPSLQKKIREQMIELFEYLMGKIDYSDSSAVVMVYELYMRCKSESCSFVELLGVLDKNETELAGKSVIQGEWKNSQEERETIAEEEIVGKVKDEKFLEEAEYYLLAEQREDSIYLTRFPFVIGQDEMGAQRDDIPEGSFGKTYARIRLCGESVYIEDMKSIKGTFVNGRRIAGNEIQKLNHGDSVMLADRCYRFMRAG